MATNGAFVGRKVRLKKGTGVFAVGIIGSQQDDLTVANGEIDVTDKDDNGYRTLLDDWGVRSIDVSINGIMKDTELLDIATSNSASVLLQNYTLEIGTIGTVTGNFFMNGFTVGAPTAEGTTFTATFLSSGEYEFVAASPSVTRPANTTRPAITGTAIVGQTLTATPGVWTGSPAISRVWLANGVPIPNATGATFVLTSAQVGRKISVMESASNSAGNTIAVSIETATVA